MFHHVVEHVYNAGEISSYAIFFSVLVDDNEILPGKVFPF